MTLPKAQPLQPVPDPAEQYIREVWKEHCDRRQAEFPLMSSAEFSLAYQWYEQGIPLSCVLRGMLDTQKSGSSLFYYRSPVEQAFKMWRHAMVGASA